GSGRQHPGPRQPLTLSHLGSAGALAGVVTPYRRERARPTLLRKEAVMAAYRRRMAMCLVVASILSVAGSVVPVMAQTRIRPGFNLFSVQQDQEIGRQSATEVEQQLPILRDADTQQYVTAIGKRLAAVAPGADYPYQFKVVNVSDINAFALPGGYMYVNRGLIEAAQSEGMLAGVMAHEMA